MSQDELIDPMAIARRELGDKVSDVGPIESVVLKEGPRSKKTARYMSVMNRHTGEVHHHALTLETGKKIQGSWELEDKRSIGFADDGVDEIGALLAFLVKVRGGPPPEPSTAEGVAKVALEHLGQLAGNVDALRRLVKLVKASHLDLEGVLAAVNLGRYGAALEQLNGLEDAQGWVEANPWILGLEHAELLETQPGLLLYRAPDDRLELVAIAPNLGGEPLFDVVEDAFQPVPELTEALGRVMGFRTEGVTRARVVIGTAGDGEQQVALMRFNEHLKGIEVLTYDRLVEMGERVMEALRATAREASQRQHL